MNTETAKLVIGPLVRQGMVALAAWLALSPTPETLNHTTDFLVALVISGISLAWSTWSDRKLLEQTPPPPPTRRDGGDTTFNSLIILACLSGFGITMFGCAEAPGFRGSIDDKGITTLDGGSTRLFGDGNRWGSSGTGAMSQATVDADGAQQQSGGGAPIGLFTITIPSKTAGEPPLVVSLVGASTISGKGVKVYSPWEKGHLLFDAAEITRDTSTAGKVAVDLAQAEADRLKALPVEQRTVAVEQLRQQAEGGSKIAAAVLDALVKSFVPVP